MKWIPYVNKDLISWLVQQQRRSNLFSSSTLTGGITSSVLAFFPFPFSSTFLGALQVNAHTAQ